MLAILGFGLLILACYVVKELYYADETKVKLNVSVYLKKTHHRAKRWPTDLMDLKTEMADPTNPLWAMCDKEGAILKLVESNGGIATYRMKFDRFAGGDVTWILHDKED